MIKARRLLFTILFLPGLIILSGWGSAGHKKISEHAPASFPYSMTFLKASWTILLSEHASDADIRKGWDPDEGPKHYIDIDDYPEFLQNGRIPQSYDSVVALHGSSFVLDKGILPWSTITAYDSLRNCFQRLDWSKAGLFAADLGHYIADGHMPLHITRNYNGQYTNQTGVHSRYESTMIGKYNTEIIYPDDSVMMIPDVGSAVFSYIYYNYQFVDSVLVADKQADSIAGSTSGNAYYEQLWSRSRLFTTDLFKRASFTLAGLIYTAWVQAGSPVMSPNALEEFSREQASLGQNFPNPFTRITKIPVTIKKDNTHLILELVDSSGILCEVLLDSVMNQGDANIFLDGTRFPQGIYYIVLKEDNYRMVRKAVLIK
jgi:hypothetical protein